MRVLLDSNVWLSIINSRRGFCRRLWSRIKRECEVFSGAAIVSEVEEKLLVKFRRSSREAARLADHVAERTHEIELSKVPPAICRDPDDDAVLALAIEAKTEFIITGDKDLLVLDGHAGIRIVTPRAFAELHRWQIE